MGVKNAGGRFGRGGEGVAEISPLDLEDCKAVRC